MDTHQKNDEEILREIVTKIYDVEADYRRMRQLLTAPPEERPRLFDGLRKNYPVRREFHRTGIKLPKNQKRLRNMLAGIGFSEISDEQ
jgi:erythronate-4-phosphate dehydrogenase